jgi:hypothetical protein
MEKKLLRERGAVDVTNITATDDIPFCDFAVMSL